MLSNSILKVTVNTQPNKQLPGASVIVGQVIYIANPMQMLSIRHSWSPYIYN